MPSHAKSFGQNLLATVDRLLPQAIRRGQELELFRARTLLIWSAVISVVFALALPVYTLDRSSVRFTFVLAVLLLSTGCLLATMRTTRHEWVAAVYMGLFSLITSRQLLYHQSLFLPVVFGYPVMIFIGFLLCGRRIGIGLACWTLLHSTLSLLTVERHGWNLPLQMNWRQLTQNYMALSFLTLFLTGCIIGCYLWLIENSRRQYRQERAWLETAESVQEILSLTARIAHTFEQPLQLMLQTVLELNRSGENKPVSAQWTRGLLELDQNAQLLHRFHRSFHLITQSVYQDRLVAIDVIDLANHLQALTWNRPASFKIQADPSTTGLLGRQSIILLLLLVIWYEAMEDPQANTLRRMHLTIADKNLVADFDAGYEQIPRLAQQLGRSLHATLLESKQGQAWSLHVPLQTA